MYAAQWNLAYNRKDVRKEIIRSGLDRVYAAMDKHVDVAGVQRTVRPQYRRTQHPKHACVRPLGSSNRCVWLLFAAVWGSGR
jgi:hypothetical protein